MLEWLFGICIEMKKMEEVGFVSISFVRNDVTLTNKIHTQPTRPAPFLSCIRTKGTPHILNDSNIKYKCFLFYFMLPYDIIWFS